MTINAVLYSSHSKEWETPDGFFQEVDREFHFTLDACATTENAKVPRNFITKEVDALRVPWVGTVWCNPPYGRDIGIWFAKARIEAQAGSTVVMLAHARTDTRWWHEYVQSKCPNVSIEVRFVKGRLKFKDAKSSAPFPSALIIYRPINDDSK
jgi:phage N-6-adenine-methyltransferase